MSSPYDNPLLFIDYDFVFCKVCLKTQLKVKCYKEIHRLTTFYHCEKCGWLAYDWELGKAEKPKAVII